MKKPTLVSIVMPLHNKEQYVRQTVQSVLQQTYSEWELLVVENGSTDRGPAIVEAFSDPRIQLIFSDDSVRGPGAARQTGIERSCGEFLLFLDADDLLSEDHVASLVKALANSSCNLAVSDWQEFEDGNTALTRKSPLGVQRDHQKYPLTDDAIAFAPWAIHAALMHRELIIGRHHWDASLDRYPSEDTAFWFKVLHDATVTYSDTCGAIYRTAHSSYRNDDTDIARWLNGVRNIVGANVSFLRTRGKTPNLRQRFSLIRVFESIAVRAYSSGRLAELRVACKEADVWLRSIPIFRCLSTSMIVRKMFGVNVWVRIRHLLPGNGA